MRKEQAKKLHNGDEVIIKGNRRGYGYKGFSAIVKQKKIIQARRPGGESRFYAVDLYVIAFGGLGMWLYHDEVK